MKTALFAFVLLSLSAVAVRAQLPSAGTLDGVGLNTNVVTDATSTALLQCRRRQVPPRGLALVVCGADAGRVQFH